MIDIGGGDSRLVDDLLARGLRCITVLDVSRAALDRARARLGPLADTPRWLQADVTGDWQSGLVDLWHDRAVFHFLTAPEDRAAYVRHAARIVQPGGHLIVATFAADGPERCSGLSVARYSAAALAHEFAAIAEPVRSFDERHVTPSGAVQAFTFVLLRAFPRAAGL